LLVCYRYIELNPVRAGMADSPAAYPWSSYGANALGAHSALVSPHPVYSALGGDAAQRQAAYREFFAAQLAPELLQDVRSCLQTGTPLGNDRFRLQIEQALGVRVGYSRRGRPKNPATGPGQAINQMELSL
jgi:putative transposase